jgi:hypothetical protein
MDRPPFQSIVYPTDFSLSNGAAFAHAVRLAIAARSALHILHIDEAGAETEQNRFPAVRELLTQWQMLEPGAPPEAVEFQLGVNVVKTALASNDVAQAVGAYGYHGGLSCRSSLIPRAVITFPVSGIE